MAHDYAIEILKSIVHAGETFSGYNKPKRTVKHPKKSHAVAAKEGDKTKLIRFGQQGVSGEGEHISTILGTGSNYGSRLRNRNA